MDRAERGGGYVIADVQTPGYMRAPFEHISVYAMKSAVDEIAYATGQDPVAVRLANHAMKDPVTGLPFSSRYVAECLRRGAERFGWADRNPEPRSMRDGAGTLIGWGWRSAPTRAAPLRRSVNADIHQIDVDFIDEPDRSSTR